MASKEVKITIVGDASSVSKAFKDASGASDGLDKSLKTTISTAAGFALGTAITKAPGALLDMAKAAAEDEQSMNRLKQAVTNADGDYSKYSKTIDNAISQGQKLAFSDDETRNALSLLVAETGSTDEAMRRLSTAQDLARGTGMSLEQASKLLGKASDENTSVLAKYGITVEKGATAQDLLNAVDSKFKGQAGTYADSAAGQMAIMGDKVGELQESIGYMLLPILAALTAALIGVADFIANSIVPALQSFAQFVQPLVSLIGDNILPIFIALSPLLAGAAVIIAGALVSAFVAWAAATWAQVAAFIALNVGMLPWIALLAAIGVAIGGLYLLWTSDFAGIQEKTQAVIDFLAPYINGFLSGLQVVFETVWPIISQVVTTYIGLVRLEIETAVAAIQAVWNVAWPAIQVIVEGVMLAVSTAVTTGMAIVGVITDGLTTINDAFTTILVPVQGIVSDVFTTIQQLVSDLWNSGAVGLIRDGLASAVDAFTGVYDTFYGFGSDIVQGLIDGITSLYDTLKGWIDKITGLLHIDVPGFSPPYDAGYKQGYAFVSGLADGTAAGLPMFAGAMTGVGGLLNLPSTGTGGLVPGIPISPSDGSDATLKQALLQLQVAQQQLTAAIATGNQAMIAQAQYIQQQAILAYQQALADFQAGVMPPAAGGGIVNPPPPPWMSPWDGLTSSPVMPPAGATPGATLPPWEETPFSNPQNSLAGGKYGGGGPGGFTGGAYLKTANGYSELAAVIKQAMKDGMREAMGGVMG